MSLLKLTGPLVQAPSAWILAERYRTASSSKILCSLVLMIVSWLLLYGDKVGEENINLLQIFLVRLFIFQKKLLLNVASGMLCNRTRSIRKDEPLEQPSWIQAASFKSRNNASSRHVFSIPGLWAEPSGVAQWHPLLSVCKHSRRSSLGQAAVLCATGTRCVFGPTDQRSPCTSGSTTAGPRAPGLCPPALLPGRTQTSARPLPCCRCCLAPALETSENRSAPIP